MHSTPSRDRGPARTLTLEATPGRHRHPAETTASTVDVVRAAQRPDESWERSACPIRMSPSSIATAGFSSTGFSEPSSESTRRHGIGVIRAAPVRAEGVPRGGARSPRRTLRCRRPSSTSTAALSGQEWKRIPLSALGHRVRDQILTADRKAHPTGSAHPTTGVLGPAAGRRSPLNGGASPPRCPARHGLARRAAGRYRAAAANRRRSSGIPLRCWTPRSMN